MGESNNLTCFDHGFAVALYQVCRPSCIARSQRMSKGVLQIPVLFKPKRSPFLQNRDLGRVDFRMNTAQKIKEQVVITEQLMSLIESCDKKPRLFQAVQNNGAIPGLGIRVDDRLA